MMVSPAPVFRAVVLCLALLLPVLALPDEEPSVTLKQATRQDIVSRARDPPMRRSASPVPYPTCADSPDSAGNGDVFATFSGMTRSWFDQVFSVQSLDTYVECAQACKAIEQCTTAWSYKRRTGRICRLEAGSYEIIPAPGDFTGHRGSDCASFVAANSDAGAYPCCNTYA